MLKIELTNRLLIGFRRGKREGSAEVGARETNAKAADERAVLYGIVMGDELGEEVGADLGVEMKIEEVPEVEGPEKGFVGF